MKTNFLIYFLLLFFIIPAAGQKLKDKRAAFKYVSLPSEKLPDDYKTYSVNVYGSNLATGGVNSGKLAESVKMNAFKRLDGSSGNHGHLRVSVNTGYTTTGSSEYKSRTDTKKDKEGNETKTTYYWYEFPFSTTGSYTIFAPDGTQMDSKNVGYSRTLKTSETTNSASLRKAYSSHRSSKRKEFASGAASNAVSQARSLLYSKYDFHHQKEWHKLYWIKKHKSEGDFKKYFDLTTKVFHEAKANTPANELKPKLQAAIDFWKEQGANDPGGDKKLRRIYRAANHNLAVVFMYLDEFDEAKKYAQAVMKLDGKDKHTKDILNTMGKMEKSMALHEINTMHYTRDVSDAIGPAKIKEIELEKETLAVAKEKENSTSSAGKVHIGGEKLEGSIVQSNKDEEMFFGAGGNTKFVVNSGDNSKEYDLSSDEIAAFEIGERSFVKKNFSPKAKGKNETKKHIMEEVYASDKITLYKYYPSTGSMGDEKTEFAYQKKSDESPVSLYDTQFLLFDKGLAKYFADCADLTTMCSESTFKMNQDDLIKAARIYSELCE